MKKNLLFLFALICSMSLFTACNDDDEPVFPVEKDMAGAYKGELGISINGQSLGGAIPQKVYISKSAAGENQLKLELKDFMFGTMNLGDIQVDPCPVTEKDGTYAFTGVQTLTLPAPIGTCPVTVAGTIKDGEIAIHIGVNVEALKQEVVATFEGTKLSGSENAEAKITAFTFDNAIITEQPIIDDAKGTITFKVSDAATDADLAALVPTITISDKAVVSPATGVVQDFSAGKSVTYMVVAEDGASNTYTVSVVGKQSVLKYSFDEWGLATVFSVEFNTPEPQNEIATSNGGVAILNGENPIGFPITKENKGFSGAAAKLVTLDARSHDLGSLAPIASGSLFTGQFVFDFGEALSNPLKLTKFGIPYTKVPVLFKGVYKYTPGDNYVDASDKNNIKDNLNIKDECSIIAVLYEAKDENAGEVTLTGVDINTSEYRVATAKLADGKAKGDWTTFELPFEYLDGKTYNKDIAYKLAIVCSSSKDGDVFKGGVGSTLLLDELEVIGE